ncbi:MAG TPA: hypothetical protein VFX19_01885 [Dehalococcoidia bacterium]|nr:hypothetical protein [Dehalococcoidia bacterium]
MQERVSLVLSTGRVSLSAGEEPSTVDVTLSNRSRVVDQFDLSLSGGQPDWYTITPDRVSLFPGESTTVKLTLHPPRREDVLAGRYELVVRATSRDDLGSASIAGIELTIVPSGGFELQLLKARDEGRRGVFRARISNLSDAPLTIALAAADPETALTFYFPQVQLQLAAYERQEIDFAVQPARRRLKGEPRAYPFSVEAAPQYPDRARAARDTQRAQGEFIYRPRFQRWPWQGLPALVNVVVPAVAAIAALSAVLVASGAVGGSKDPPTTPDIPNIAATLSARDAASAATVAAQQAQASATSAAATAVATMSVTPTPSSTPTITPTPPATPSATPKPNTSPTATRSPLGIPPIIIGTVIVAQ